MKDIKDFDFKSTDNFIAISAEDWDRIFGGDKQDKDGKEDDTDSGTTKY
jgi:hypothetical protein